MPHYLSWEFGTQTVNARPRSSYIPLVHPPPPPPPPAAHLHPFLGFSVWGVNSEVLCLSLVIYYFHKNDLNYEREAENDSYTSFMYLPVTFQNNSKLKSPKNYMMLFYVKRLEEDLYFDPKELAVSWIFSISSSNTLKTWLRNELNCWELPFKLISLKF